MAMVIALGTLLNPLNSSMIAIALVSLQRTFDVGIAASSWLISGFYLSAAVAQPLMGRIADRFGPRRVYLGGLAIVCASGIGAMVSPGFGWVVACRVVQALGTSAAFPAGLALIRRISGGGRPPAATLGTISVTNSASAALGPVLGGFLVAFGGWQGIFAVNVPLSIVAFVLALCWLPADRASAQAAAATTGAAHPAGAAQPAGDRGVLAQLDLPGVALFTAALVSLLAFLLSVSTGPRWPLLAVAPVAAALLVWRELRAPLPFLDLRALAGNLALVAVLGQQLLTQAVFYLMFFGLPMWLERVRHFPVEAAGLLMLPVAALGVVTTPAGAWLVARRGPRIPLALGSAMLVAGSATLLTLDDRTGALGIIAATALLGLPNGLNNMGLQGALYASAPAAGTGTAAGLFQTCRYVGAIGSTALLGLLFTDDLTTAGLHRIALVGAALATLLVAIACFSGRRT
jgi:MFS family permease